MSDPESNLKSLHDKYCQLTGRNLRYTFYQNEWREWSRHFQADDLCRVLTWVEQENRKRQKQYMIRTELLRIIGDVQTFEQLRAEAELAEKAKAAKARAFKPSAGQIALAEMRHEPAPTPPETPAKRLSMESVVEALKGAKQ